MHAGQVMAIGWGIWSLAALGCAAAHPATTGDPEAIEAMCRNIAEALCRARQTCCPDPDARIGELDCRDILTRRCGTETTIEQRPAWGDLPLWPDMKLDARGAEELTAHFEVAADACTVPPRLESVQGLLSPYKVHGDPCSLDHECRSGSVCRPSADNATVCAPIGDAGDPCLTDRQCDASLWCVTHPNGALATCEAAGQLGDACIPAQCAAGLACRTTAELTWTCQEPPPVGATCEGDYFTQWRTCGDLGHCAYAGGPFECRPSMALGEQCAEDEVCLSRLCSLVPGASVCIACTPEACEVGRCENGQCLRNTSHPSPPVWPITARAFSDGEACSGRDQCLGGACADGHCASTTVADDYCQLIITAP